MDFAAADGFEANGAGDDPDGAQAVHGAAFPRTSAKKKDSRLRSRPMAASSAREISRRRRP